MYEKYKELFDLYLDWVKKWYKKDNSREYKRHICITCNRYRDRLQGMLELMNDAGEISQSKKDAEWKNVENTFSAKNLFGIGVVYGELYEFGREQINE